MLVFQLIFPISQLFSTFLDQFQKFSDPPQFQILNFNQIACFLYFISPLKHKNENHFLVTLSQPTQPWSPHGLLIHFCQSQLMWRVVTQSRTQLCSTSTTLKSNSSLIRSKIVFSLLKKKKKDKTSVDSWHCGNRFSFFSFDLLHFFGLKVLKYKSCENIFERDLLFFFFF